MKNVRKTSKPEDKLAKPAEGAISDEELSGVAGGIAPKDDILERLLSFDSKVYTDGQAPTDFWRP